MQDLRKFAKIQGNMRKSSKKFRQHRKKVYPQVEGRVQMTREGYIFVIVEGEDEDVFVKASKTKHALDGDIVKVAVTKQSNKEKGKRKEGEVVEIVRRSGKPFVGIYHSIGDQAWVLMQSKSMPYDIEVDPKAAEEAGSDLENRYSLVVEDGFLLVFPRDGDRVCMYTHVPITDFPESEQERLRAGIWFSSMLDIFNYLESYTS